MDPASRIPDGPVKLLVLSRNPTLYSTRRLVEAAHRQGHRPLVADPLQCRLELRATGAVVCFGRQPLQGVGVAVPRIGASITRYGVPLVRHLEDMGIPVVNPAAGIWNARDRLACLQSLARARLPIPETVAVQSAGDVPDAVEAVGGPPVVLKLAQGAQGVGVMLAETAESAESMLEALWSLGEGVLVQRFVAESRGQDLRAVVVGDRVVAAMRRHARKGDFRANVHRGGTCEEARLDPALAGTVLAASRALGLKVAGVDLLESSRGPLVIEVNSSPGFEGLEQATGRDVAGAIVDHAARLGNDAVGAVPPGPEPEAALPAEVLVGARI